MDYRVCKPKMTAEQVKAKVAAEALIPVECLPEPVFQEFSGQYSPVGNDLWRFPPFAGTEVEGPSVHDRYGVVKNCREFITSVLCHGPITPAALLERERAEFKAKLAEAESRAVKWNTGVPDDDREVMIACWSEGTAWIELARFRRDYGDSYMGIEGVWFDDEMRQKNNVMFWAERPKLPEVQNAK